MTVVDVAISYCRRGWSVIPVPHRSKNPGFNGWERMRLKEDDLPAHFNGRPQNIGVLLGQPSGGLVDIDLDTPEAIDLATIYLPATSAVFGRKSKPRSHYLYRCTGPIDTKSYKNPVGNTEIFRLGSTGAQTVFPGSTHQDTGELIHWDDEGEPTEVSPEELLAAAYDLHCAVLAVLGIDEAPEITPVVRDWKPVALPKPDDPEIDWSRVPIRLYGDLTPYLRTAFDNELDIVQRTQQGGRNIQLNKSTFQIATIAGVGLIDPSLIDGMFTEVGQSTGLKGREVARTIASAIRGGMRKPRRNLPREAWPRAIPMHADNSMGTTSEEADQDTDDPVRLGTHDPQTGRLVLSPKRTLPTAEAFIGECHHHRDGRSLHSYAGTLLVWRGNRFVEIEEESLRQRLQPWLHRALRYQFNKQTHQMELVAFESNPGTIKSAVESIRAYAHLPVSVTPPSWLSGRTDLPDPQNLLPFPSGTLDLATGKILAPTPALFNINAIDFDYDPSPEPPGRWLKFLEQLWGDDLESVELLQEWMGYCLVADTRQQKIMLMVGPKRSGKGTIGRVLSRLVGAGNVVGPTTSSLAGPFGLQPLIGKSLAIVSDARFSGESVGVVVERLLCISGEDTLTVDRKFLGSVTMKLPTRFMFLTNELPRMNDSSGALAGRFVILRLIRSFYGQEDIALAQQLMQELPGILVWAIEGLKRLRARGHFVQPKAVSDAVQEMEDLASPVLAFVRDCCEVGVGRRTWIDDLYEAWKRWCENDGRNTVTSKQVFGRDLAAAVPGVACRRHSSQGRFYDGIALRIGGTM